MAFQPSPQTSLISTEQTRYMLAHSHSCVTPGVSKIDETHIHSCYEAYVNVTGHVRFLVNDRIYPVEEGNVILTRPNDVHVCVFPQLGEYEHYCLWIEDPDNVLFRNAQTTSFEPLIVLPARESEQLLALLGKLGDSGETQLHKTAAFFGILMLLENNGYGSDASMPVPIPEQMQKILLHMNTNFLEIQHVYEVCEHFYVSQATLSRWFRKYTGISPGTFLESKKLAYAKERLNRGETVTQAGLQAGFSDCSHFIRIFKKKFGETPKAYQQRCNIASDRTW